MFIQGIGTATPEQRYSQLECWAALQQATLYTRLPARAQAILRKVLTGPTGIQTRHLALDRLEDAFDLQPDTLYRRFATHAPLLAARAAQAALDQAGLHSGSIDAVLVSTCTGYLCPGLTSYLTESLGLRPAVFALDLVGQGCGAALPNLRTAQALLASGRYDRVLSVCVEVCSAALYLDSDPGVLISACLFGDGAAAAVLGSEPARHPRVEWLASDTFISPRDRDLLRFEQREGKLRNLLSLRVPALAAEHVSNLIERLLRQSEVNHDGISTWILHPGGRDVLAALRQRLGLSEADVAWSSAVLRDYGNLSSPSVFFALKHALTAAAPEGYWLLSSFGAGFSCHAAVLQVQHQPATPVFESTPGAHGTHTCERIA